MNATDTRPTNPSAEAVGRLRLAIARLARRLRLADEPGLSVSQISALSSIERHGPLTLGELAALENVSPPTISRVVGTLEGEGWVRRTPDERDRRAVLVATTTAATKELHRIRHRRDAWLQQQLADLTAEERERLMAALPVLEKLMGPDR